MQSLYKLKKCSKNGVNNVDVKFEGTLTKWPVQKPTDRTTRKHVEHHDATAI